MDAYLDFYRIAIAIGCLPILVQFIRSIIEYNEKRERENAEALLRHLDRRNSWERQAELFDKVLESYSRYDVQKPIKHMSCPNCGAPVRGNECEYCGTIFESR